MIVLVLVFAEEVGGGGFDETIAVTAKALEEGIPADAPPGIGEPVVEVFAGGVGFAADLVTDLADGVGIVEVLDKPAICRLDICCRTRSRSRGQGL